MAWLRSIQICSQNALLSVEECPSADKAVCDEDVELRVLLTDRRLVRVSDKKLVYSHIVGKAAGFLSGCCDDVACPLAQPFVASAVL